MWLVEIHTLSAAVFQTVSMTCRHTDTWSPSWPATTPVSTAPVPTPSYAVSPLCAPTETSPVGTPSGKGRDAVNLSVPVSRLVNNHFLGFFIHVIPKVKSANNRIIRHLLLISNILGLIVSVNRLFWWHCAYSKILNVLNFEWTLNLHLIIEVLFVH